jgi:hypothetical protein
MAGRKLVDTAALVATGPALVGENRPELSTSALVSAILHNKEDER